MKTATLTLLCAACLSATVAGPAPALAQESAAEVLDIVRDLTPRPDPGVPGAEPRYVAEAVHFAFGSDRLAPAARRQLERVARAMESGALAGLRFRIEGHTDSRGAAEYNRALSERRARAVAAWLVTFGGIDADRLDTAGYGESRPREPLAPDSAVNRRVEIVTLAPRAETARAPVPPHDGPVDAGIVDEMLTGRD